MTPERYKRAKDVFLEVCDLADSELAARLAALTGEDPQLVDDVNSMLRHDRAAEPLTAVPGVRSGLEGLFEDEGAAAAGSSGAGLDTEFVPETIGPYKVLRRLGSGGMGDVFEGQQETPRRSVAIKLMRTGLGSEAMVRRFRREVEFLGRLSHPGIAQIFEAGVTVVGTSRVPYYAMELVMGLPLTVFALQRALSVEARLRLFVSICETVQYAHQQGIIHRDLKPANILVQDADVRTRTGSGTSTSTAAVAAGGGWSAGQGVPRILDFGIARAVAADGEDSLAGDGGYGRTIATEAGQVVGTVPYMSPEQISGRTGEIDTRTDVYALGVILFELLTGRLPFATEGLSLLEAAKLKTETAAMRLSAADGRLRGDLETIVGKALETEKGRRYASVSDLGMDVRRYLSDEVITARPATLTYQLGKFARRNRGVVVAAGLAVVTLVGGVVATVLQARDAMRQRDVAIEKTAVAIRKTEVAEAVSDVLLQSLTMATPKGFVGKEPRLIDAIGGTEVQALEDSSKLPAEARAVVLNVVGIIWRERGDYERAERVLSKALELRRKVLASDDPNLGDSLMNLGLLRKKQERYAEAAALQAESLEVQRRSPVPDESRLARALYNTASAYISAGERGKAMPLLEESLALHRKLIGQEHEVIAMHLSAMARLAVDEARMAEAEKLAEESLAMCRRCVGPNHPSIASGLQELAIIVAERGDAARAVALLTEADVMAHKVFAVEPPHPVLLGIRKTLVSGLRATGRDQEAERLEKDVSELPR